MSVCWVWDGEGGTFSIPQDREEEENLPCGPPREHCGVGCRDDISF